VLKYRFGFDWAENGSTETAEKEQDDAFISTHATAPQFPLKLQCISAALL
jgi:hypothetical protein